MRRDPQEYSEYGYRGTEELRKANEEILKLKKEVEELKIRLQRVSNENK